MLQSRGYYTFKAGGEDITIRFCTYSIKRFCERNGNLTASGFFEKMAGEFTLSEFVDLLLCAAEAVAVEHKKEFAYTDFDASNWFDEIGGFASPGFKEIIQVLVQSQLPQEKPKGKNVKSR